ncbi:alpha/beta hydrolase family protein [Marmoricola sp. RAF53]|uniref:alpha/beta hydrolase family protein n=1 Tax=Marmoricola sp. RAF53 TaxID=3233059 RepID=UPI003F9B10E7
MSTSRRVPTPQGDARLVTYRAREPQVTLVLTHGAGGGIEAADLVALAGALPRHGITVVLVEMPWRVVGKKLAPRPALIDQAYTSVLAALRPRTPVVLGGRSAGARAACRIAAGAGAAGVLALAFPLHPPGKPEKSRLDELEGAGVPTLVVQGERDPFGTPAEFPADVDLAVVPSGDHALRVPRSAPLTQQEAFAVIAEAVLEWIVREVTG